MRITKTLLLSAVLALGLSCAVFAEPSGTAKGVDPEASALLDNVVRTLTVGSDIFLGDKITTGPKGLVQIVFADNTKLVVGPDSSLTIDDYLIRNDGSVGKLAINMLGGTFRFITGDSPKSAYEIKTPTGAIGVRGTAFDSYVEEFGPAHVLMYLGTTILKEYGGDSEVLHGLCEVGEINDATVELVGNTAQIEGVDRDELKKWFRWSLNQSELLREFWLAHALECLRKPPVNDTPPSLLGQPGSPCPPGQVLYYGEGGPYCDYPEGY